MFLDRDGTLIESDVVDGRPVPFHDAGDLRVARRSSSKGAPNSRQPAIVLVMVTNQPDIARGTAAATVIEAVNTQLVDALGLDLALMCPHDDADDCDCRKPKPGLLQQGAEILSIALDHSSFMVGDRWRDIDAGHNCGCHDRVDQPRIR